MRLTSNTIYAKDDGSVTIYSDGRVEWYWDNGPYGKGVEIYSYEEAARELEMAGRENLAELVRETLSGE